MDFANKIKDKDSGQRSNPKIDTRSLESSIPLFYEYYPSQSTMNVEQKQFYLWLCDQLDKKKYPKVDGNISYLFAYAYNILGEWKKTDKGKTYSNLIRLVEAYHDEPKFSSYMRFWASDCLIGSSEYERYLIETEPEKVENTMRSNTRCNVAWLLGEDPSPMDILGLFGARITKKTKDSIGQFKDFFADVLAEHYGSIKGVLSRANKDNKEKTYDHYLFSGAPIGQMTVDFPYYCFYSSMALNDELREASREAENRLREAQGLPKVGEGWVNETALFRALETTFQETLVIHHGRPGWLGKQHLDVWFPRWNVAVEYQGKQHFMAVEYFGGQDAFAVNKERDERKRRLCRENGVHLIEVVESEDFDGIVQKIRAIKPAIERTKW